MNRYDKLQLLVTRQLGRARARLHKAGALHRSEPRLRDFPLWRRHERNYFALMGICYSHGGSHDHGFTNTATL